MYMNITFFTVDCRFHYQNLVLTMKIAVETDDRNDRILRWEMQTREVRLSLRTGSQPQEYSRHSFHKPGRKMATTLGWKYLALLDPGLGIIAHTQEPHHR